MTDLVQHLPTSLDNITYSPNPSYSLNHFSSPTSSDVTKLLLKVNSSSLLDPIPIKLLHDIAPDIAEPLRDIFTKSLNNGIIPLTYKHAIITPILKKPNLDPNILKNFRPISNLSIFSKTLERIVAKQLINFLTSNNLCHSLQSAYMPKKSTETALIKISSDLLSNLDNKYGSILALLDLSAAFDTINHDILIKRLQEIGITDMALAWLTSFITGRTTSICIEKHSSPARTTTHGVPQGSVLGPILFNIYIIPLLNLIDTLQIKFHNYADDIQLYTNCSQDPTIAPSNISYAINQIGKWLSSNSLCFNPHKTEILFLHLPVHNSQITLPPPVICDDTPIVYSTKVRNLGVIFDTTLSFKNHISHTIKSIHYQIHQLRLIRKSISIDTAKLISSAYILPIFDYCNSLLLHLQSYQITRLQTLQNSLVRCIFKINHFSHDRISPLLIELHWLPIRQRILYKSLLLTHKAIHHNSPSYLTNLIPLLKTPTINTRSTNTFMLELPSKFQKSSTNIRSWSISAPYSWNTIPSKLRCTSNTSTFKSLLKTYLFKIGHKL